MSDKPRIGFIGVGLMGHGAARNILERGDYRAHRPRPSQSRAGRRPRRAAAPRRRDDPAALAAASDVVFLCLPSSVEVEAAVHGDARPPRRRAARHGLRRHAPRPIPPRRARSAPTSRIGCRLVDAALGRTPKEAEDGKLSHLCRRRSGDHRAGCGRSCRRYADTIVVCGALGAGTTCKLVNNSITIGMSALIAEGFATAAKLGVDLDALADVLSAGGVNGRMWQMMRAVDPLAATTATSRGTMWIGAKDVRTYGRMAESAGVADLPRPGREPDLPARAQPGPRRPLPAGPPRHPRRPERRQDPRRVRGSRPTAPLVRLYPAATVRGWPAMKLSRA